MAVAKGFKVNLFADEKKFPQLINPVQMQFDTKGRLWAAVWPTYPKWEPLKPMNDALLIFHDDDGDGRADRVTEFAKVQNPLGFEFWNGGVIVTCMSELLFLKDTKGDGVADVRIVLLQGLDSADTHHGANNLDLRPRWRASTGRAASSWRTTTSTRGGRRCRAAPRRCTASTRAASPSRCTPATRRTRTASSFDYWGYQYATDGTGGRAYQVRPDGAGFKMTELLKKEVRPVTASAIVSSTHFPESMQGDFLICNVIGFLGIKQYHLERNPETGVVWGEPDGDELTVTTHQRRRHEDRGEIARPAHERRQELPPVRRRSSRPTARSISATGRTSSSATCSTTCATPTATTRMAASTAITAEGRPLQAPVAIDGQPIPALLENLKSPVDGIRHRTHIELSGRDSKEVIAATQQWMKQFDPKKKEDAHHSARGALDSPAAQRPQRRVARRRCSSRPSLTRASRRPRSSISGSTSTPRSAAASSPKAPELVLKKSGILSDTAELTTIRIATVRERMTYDTKELTVKAGKKVPAHLRQRGLHAAQHRARATRQSRRRRHESDGPRRERLRGRTSSPRARTSSGRASWSIRARNKSSNSPPPPRPANTRTSAPSPAITSSCAAR